MTNQSIEPRYPQSSDRATEPAVVALWRWRGGEERGETKESEKGRAERTRERGGRMRMRKGGRETKRGGGAGGG